MTWHKLTFFYLWLSQSLLHNAAIAEMYDAVFPVPVASGKCAAFGCAKWNDLAADGNTRSQSDVNAKWAAGHTPDNAERNCAMPANDVSSTYWCYCRNVNSSAWDYCDSPSTPTPEQINVQHTGQHEVAVISFVTFGENSTEVGLGSPQVRWGTSKDHLDRQADGVSRLYIDTGREQRKYYMHFVKLSDLEPRTRYYYQVQSPGSDWFPQQADVLSFTSLYYGIRDGGQTKVAIFGDMGVYSWNNMGNLIRDVSNGLIDAVVHLGDHAYNIAENDGRRGDGYLNAFQPIISSVPWIPVLGNHEMYGDSVADNGERYFNQTWGVVIGNEPSDVYYPASSSINDGSCHNTQTPLNSMLAYSTRLGTAHHGARASPPSNTSRYYSADIGLIHFVALDLNVYYFDEEAPFRKPQLAWLQADLIAASANRAQVPWICVMSHYPMYCSSVTLGGKEHNDGQGDEDPGNFTGCWSYGTAISQLREDLEPLMQAHHVDVYFAGHEHDYEVIWPIVNNTVVARNFTNPTAPVHIVTGAGGAPALDRFGPPAPFTKSQLSAWGYGRLTTTNDSVLTYSHVLNSNGSIYDVVNIVRSTR
jgi:hypothetical protein